MGNGGTVMRGHPSVGGPIQPRVSASAAVTTGSPDNFQAKYSAEAENFTGLTDESFRLLVSTEFAYPINIDYTFQSRSGGTSAVQGPGTFVRIVGGAASQGGLVRAAFIGSLMDEQQAKRFYAVCAFRLATNLPNANSRIYFQVGQTVVCGVAAGINGTQQTAKWAFSTNNIGASAPLLTVLSTQAPFVGQLNVARIWYDGDATWGSFNGETPIQIADASVMTTSIIQDGFYFDSFPAGPGQTDAVDIDYMYLWGEQ